MKLYCVLRLLHNHEPYAAQPGKNRAWAETAAAAAKMIYPDLPYNPTRKFAGSKYDSVNDISVSEDSFCDYDPAYGGNSEKIINPEQKPF